MRAILSTQAPAPIGPYSQAIESGNFVFCSGQVAIVPSDGELITGDISAQAAQALKNLGEVLKAAHLSYADVVKTTIFLIDMDDFAAVNTVYAEYFGQTKPARSTIAVCGLPKNARIEIEAIAQRS